MSVSPNKIAHVEEILSSVEMSQNQPHQMTEEEVRLFLQSFPEFRDCRFEVEIVQAQDSDDLQGTATHNPFTNDFNFNNTLSMPRDLTDEYLRIDTVPLTPTQIENLDTNKLKDYINTESLMATLNKTYELTAPEEEMKDIVWKDEDENKDWVNHQTTYHGELIPNEVRAQSEQSVYTSNHIYRIPPMPSPNKTASNTNVKSIDIEKPTTPWVNVSEDQKNNIYNDVRVNSPSISQPVQFNDSKSQNQVEDNTDKVDNFDDSAGKSKSINRKSQIKAINDTESLVLPSVQELANKFSKTLSQSITEDSNYISKKPKGIRDSSNTGLTVMSKRESAPEFNKLARQSREILCKTEKNVESKKDFKGNLEENEKKQFTDSFNLQESKRHKQKQRKQHDEITHDFNRRRKYCYIDGEKFKIVDYSDKPYYDLNNLLKPNKYDMFYTLKKNRRHKSDKKCIERTNTMFPSMYRVSTGLKPRDYSKNSMQSKSNQNILNPFQKRNFVTQMNNLPLTNSNVYNHYNAPLVNAYTNQFTNMYSRINRPKANMHLTFPNYSMWQ